MSASLYTEGAATLHFVVRDGGAVVDISAATAMDVVLRSPKGQKRVRTADFETDGTDGRFTYITVPADLNKAGTWQAQGRVTLDDVVYYSEILVLPVVAPL